MERKGIHCKHSLKSKSFFAYRLFGQYLLLCPRCERILRREILRQIGVESKLKKGKM